MRRIRGKKKKQKTTNMNDLRYIRISSENDIDVSKLIKIYRLPEISRFISISENYFNYVTNTENVYFYKIFHNETLVGAIHLEKCGDVLYMDILILPEFQRTGFGTRVIKDIQNDVFGLRSHRIEISIDEKNIASIKLFEKVGFEFSSKEDELISCVYQKNNDE